MQNDVPLQTILVLEVRVTQRAGKFSLLLVHPAQMSRQMDGGHKGLAALLALERGFTWIKIKTRQAV